MSKKPKIGYPFQATEESAAALLARSSAETRLAHAFGLLVGTVGSIRDYTADDLRVRIRYAVAVLGGKEQDIEKAAEADGEMQRNFDEDGNRIADVGF